MNTTKEASHMLRYQHHAVGMLISVMNELEDRGVITQENKTPQGRLDTLARICAAVVRRQTMAAIAERDTNLAAGLPETQTEHERRYEHDVLTSTIRNHAAQPGSTIRWNGWPGEERTESAGPSPTGAGRVPHTTVRKMQAGDTEGLAELFDATKEPPETTHPEGVNAEISQADCHEVDQRVNRACWYGLRPNHALVATVDGKVAGFAALRHHDEMTTELKEIVVHPEQNETGIRSRLMAAAERAALEGGYQRIVLWTTGCQRDTIRAYQDRGYHRRRDVTPSTNETEPILSVEMELNLIQE